MMTITMMLLTMNDADDDDDDVDDLVPLLPPTVMHSSLLAVPPISTLVSRPWLIVHLPASTVRFQVILPGPSMYLVKGSFVRTVNTTVESRLAW